MRVHDIKAFDVHVQTIRWIVFMAFQSIRFSVRYRRFAARRLRFRFPEN